MNRSIDLDNQKLLKTTKVNNKPMNYMLAAKLEISNLPIS